MESGTAPQIPLRASPGFRVVHQHDLAVDDHHGAEQRPYIEHCIDARVPDALPSIEATTCQTAIVTMGESFEAAVLAVAALREIGVPHVVARSPSRRQSRILSAVGAAQVMEVEAEMGRRLAQELAARGPADET